MLKSEKKIDKDSNWRDGGRPGPSYSGSTNFMASLAVPVDPSLDEVRHRLWCSLSKLHTSAAGVTT